MSSVVNIWISLPTGCLPSYLTWTSGRILPWRPDLKSRVTLVMSLRPSLSRFTTSSRLQNAALRSLVIILLFRRPPLMCASFGGSFTLPTPSRSVDMAERDSPSTVPAKSRYQPCDTPCSCAGPLSASSPTEIGANGQSAFRAKAPISAPTLWSLYLTKTALGASEQSAKHSTSPGGTAPYVAWSPRSSRRRISSACLSQSSFEPSSQVTSYRAGSRKPVYQSHE
mmetsp:Transcript_115196/g.320990  ORF Transcript_115196/g.320990 Transcript_115196/m.320990 type:complete len:225 (-) Transcript_115196:239-913(-)